MAHVFIFFCTVISTDNGWGSLDDTVVKEDVVLSAVVCSTSFDSLRLKAQGVGG